MGSGKTTWAINEMNTHPDQRYLYVTPYINEITRIVEKCDALHMKTPSDRRSTKYDSFRRLLKDGESIAMTHELFSSIHLTPMMREQFQEYGYHLILDETLDVIEPIQISKSDINLLFQGGLITTDANGVVKWMDSKYKGKHSDLKHKAENKTLIWFEDKLFIWTFPFDIFPLFQSVSILTFLFDGSHMKYYFDLHSVPYERYHVRQGELRYGQEDLSDRKAELLSLISIYNGQLNNIGDRYTSLSSNWYRKRDKANVPISNARYYFDSIRGAHSTGKDGASNCMYAVFKECARRYEINGFSYKNCFVPANARATNEYMNRKHLAYLINVFDHPFIVRWFEQQGIKINQNQYALAQLLQWIWRSAIRNGDKIMLFLPSKRMRTLLIYWLYGLDVDEIDEKNF